MSDDTLVDITTQGVNYLRITMMPSYDKEVTFKGKSWGISWKLNRHGEMAILKVTGGSRASQEGLMPGMVLKKVNGTEQQSVGGSVSIEEDVSAISALSVTSVSAAGAAAEKKMMGKPSSQKLDERGFKEKEHQLNKLETSKGPVVLSFQRDSDYQYIDGVYQKGGGTNREFSCTSEQQHMKLFFQYDLALQPRAGRIEGEDERWIIKVVDGKRADGNFVADCSVPKGGVLMLKQIAANMP